MPALLKFLTIFISNPKLVTLAPKLEAISAGLGLISSTLNGIINPLKNAAEGWAKFDDKASKTARSLGLANSEIKALRQTLISQQIRLSALFDVDAEKIIQFQESLTQATERMQMLSAKEMETWAGLSKLVPEEAIANMAKNVDDMGGSLKAAQGYLAMSRKQAQKFGIDVKEASKAFANNMKMANTYGFKNGINGVMRMTMLSKELKFNMDSIANASEKFASIEGAIENSAKIQMLGGDMMMQFGNPLDVMSDAMMNQEDFTERIINSVGNKAVFNRATGAAEITNWLDRAKIKELASTLGMSAQELTTIATKTATNAEMDKSMKNKSAFEQAGLMDAIHSMAKFDPEKQKFYITTSDGKDHDIDNLTPDEFKKLMPQVDVDDIDTNVKNIAHNLSRITESMLGEARDSMSTSEMMNGIKGSMDAVKANSLEAFNIGETGKELLRTGSSMLATLDNIYVALGLVFGSSLFGGISGFFKGFNEGGIVGGNSTQGDKVFIRANSNEMVLTPQQQSNLFKIAQGQTASVSMSPAMSTVGHMMTNPMTQVAVAASIRQSQRQHAELASPNLMNTLISKQILAADKLIGAGNKLMVVPEDFDTKMKRSEQLKWLQENVSSKGKKIEAVAQETAKSEVKKPSIGSRIANSKLGVKTKNAFSTVKNSSFIKGTGKVLGHVGRNLGGYMMIAGSAIEGASAYSNYKTQSEMIESRRDLSRAEKNAMLQNAKNERNAGYGGAIGGALGAGLGMMFGPLGALAGGMLGKAAGQWIGGKWNDWFGTKPVNMKKDNDVEATTSYVTPNGSTYSSVQPTSVIGDRTYVSEKTSRETYNSSNNTSSSVSAIKDINLNINGSIKLDASNYGAGAINIDLASLVQSPQFKRQIIDIINENVASINGKRDGEYLYHKL